MVLANRFPNEYVQQASELFRLLSDRTRLGLLLLLAEGEQNVGQLCSRLDLPQPTVSHHLALMRMSGLLSKRRNGKQMIYRVNPDMLGDLADKFVKYMSEDGTRVEFNKIVLTLNP